MATIYSGPPLQSSLDAFGCHFHNLPNEGVDTFPITFGAARSLDYCPPPDYQRLTWAAMQPARGAPTQWATADRWVNTHARASRKLLFTVVGTPEWASSDPQRPAPYGPGASAPPTDPGDLWQFAHAVAHRYAGLLDFEVYNEPSNSDGRFWSGTKEELAQAVRVVRQAVHAADPRALIVSPACTGWQNGGHASGYFVDMMAADDGAGGTMRDHVDIVGAHFYPTSMATHAQVWEEIVPNVRAAMATAGVAGLPLWCTEFGIDDDDPTFLAQPDGVATQVMLRMIIGARYHDAGGADRLFWYDGDGSRQGMTTGVGAGWNQGIGLLVSHPVSPVTVTAAGVMRVQSGALSIVLQPGNQAIRTRRQRRAAVR